MTDELDAGTTVLTETAVLSVAAVPLADESGVAVLMTTGGDRRGRARGAAPARRRFSRPEARRRYQRAHSALAGLTAVASAPPVEPVASPGSAADEVVAASWRGWEA